MFVDTPGVGESKEMTEKLLEYLPEALVFIYVINSSNAGGVQEDRVLTFMKPFRDVFIEFRSCHDTCRNKILVYTSSCKITMPTLMTFSKAFKV